MNTLLKKTFVIILISVSFLACSSNSGKKKLDDEKPLEKGKIIPSVSCLKDKGTNYALYLPSTYDTAKTYPIIIAFDSHADGLKPVTLFQKEAEKYGYIVVGSNNSKNGTIWTTTNEIYKSMLTDVQSRFSINPKRIYTAGFSGGSRVASTIAIQNGGIAGVVGFSAGFPSLNQRIKNKFDYLGIVGNADFNYNEMNNLDKYLESIGFNHYLLVFDGKHEWPSPILIPDVFYWLEFCAIRNNVSSTNSELVKEFKNKVEIEIKNNKAKNNLFNAYLNYLKLVRYLDGVVAVDSLKAKISELEKTPAIQNGLKAVEDDNIKEQMLQGKYMNEMNAKDSKWWTAEVKRINNLIKQNTNKREGLIYKRIFSYLSIGAYTYSNNALKNNQQDQAQHFITIYSLVDPENSESSYFQAVLNSRKNDTLNAIKSIEKAVNLGFNDLNRLQNDTDFFKLTSTKEYNQLLEKMKAKK